MHFYLVVAGGGGIVNRVTKTATLNESFTALNAAFDTFAGRQISIDRNQQLDANQALRLNAFYEQLDNHRDNYDGQRFAINPTYTNNINDTTQLVLSYEYVDDDRAVDRGIPSLNDRPLIGQSDSFFGHPSLNFSNYSSPCIAC